MKITSRWFLGLSIVLAHPAIAQPKAITIAVEIQDSTNQLASAFRTAFRQIGDVRVTDASERPDYVLSGIAMCNPSCAELSHYSLVLRLYAPIKQSMADMLVRLVLHSGAPISRDVRASLRAEVWRHLGPYEVTLRTSLVYWGRQRYEQGVREFVRDIDSRCFESIRAMKRAAASEDSTAWTTYEALQKTRDWIC